MVLDSIVTTLTQDTLLPQVSDAVMNGNVLAMRMMSSPKAWSGETLKIPFMYAKSGSGGAYDGLDILSTSRTQTRAMMSFNIKGTYQSVNIAGMDRGVNDSAKVLDLIGTEMEVAKMSLNDTIGSMWYGDGTGTGGKEFTGLISICDDGTNVASYGGQSRTIYTGLRGNYTASSGALTLAKMATMFDSCALGASVPTLIVTTQAIWSGYEVLCAGQIQLNYSQGYTKLTRYGIAAPGAALTATAGFNALTFRGVPVVADEKCTSGYMYFLNENTIAFYSMARADLMPIKSKSGSNVEGFYSQAGVETTPFQWREFKDSFNQDGMSGFIFINGEIVCTNPRLNGVLRGVTV